MSNQFISDANNPTTISTRDIYNNHLEAPFLQDIENFYRHEAITSLDHSSVAEYMKKV